jgi:hypothetical protein
MGVPFRLPSTFACHSSTSALRASRVLAMARCRDSKVAVNDVAETSSSLSASRARHVYELASQGMKSGPEWSLHL